MTAKKIVVADDDADIRQLVVIAASRAGVEIVAAVDNGSDAWAAVSGGGIDLAVLDISMPGLSGLEVADLIRQDPLLASTRVLMVSASVQMMDAHAALQASVDSSFDRFILKPFSPRELTGVIASMTTEQDGT